MCLADDLDSFGHWSDTESYAWFRRDISRQGGFLIWQENQLMSYFDGGRGTGQVQGFLLQDNKC